MGARALTILRTLPRLLRITLRRPLSRRSRRHPAVLIAWLLFIGAWQTYFEHDTPRIARTCLPYRLNAATGLLTQEPLFYFYYYLGLYPVATTLPAAEQSAAGARTIVEKHGDSLVMEVGIPSSAQIRNGDHTRMLLYYPDAIGKRGTQNLTPRPANVGGFILSLMAVTFAFWWIGLPALGGVLVLLIGSHPMQLFEVYARPNIFGWTITTANFALALCLPLLDPRGPRWKRAVILCVLLGLLLGTIRTVRMESALIVLSALGAAALVRGFPWRRRLALVVVLAAGFLGTQAAWNQYWKTKIANAYDVVEKAGGAAHPAALTPAMNHDVLFPLWTGLGDFGAAKGYAWSDLAAHHDVQGVLQKKYGVPFPRWTGGYTLDGSFLDAKKRYPRLPYDVPHYFDIIRDKIVSDLRQDPGWYLGILARRAWSILADLPSASVVIGQRMPFEQKHRWWIFPLMVGLLAWSRNAFLLKLALFTLPLSLPALLVYSKGGMIFAATYHLFGIGILGGVLFYGAAWWVRFRQRCARHLTLAETEAS